MSCKHPSLDIATWGRAGWLYLHAVTFNYAIAPSIEERQDAHAFLVSFTKSIPCSVCRRDFAQMTKEARATYTHSTFDGRDAFTRAVHSWHNEVNVKLNKPIVPFYKVQEWFAEEQPVNTHSKFVLFALVLFLTGILLKGSKSSNFKRV